MPNLSIPRYVCASFTFNKEVYALGGYAASYLNSMEKLNLYEPSKWVAINISNAFSARYTIHAIQVGPAEVIVFGGNPSDETYMLNIGKTVTCKSLSKLCKSSQFYMSSAPIFDGLFVYGVDIGRGLHIYSMSESKWSIVNP